MEPLLPKDMITQPELWRCLLHLTPTRLHAALTPPPVAGEDMVNASILLNPDTQSELKRIEDAVYDNPLLLSEFRSIHALVWTPDYTVVPAELAHDRHTAARLLAMALGREVDSHRVSVGCEMGGAVLLYELPEGTEAFLKRTFFGVTMSHPLEDVGFEAVRRSEVNSQEPVMIAVADSANALTVVAARAGKLLMLNEFAVTHPDDGAYYLLACRSSLGLGRDEGAVMFAGQAPLARTVANILAPYIPSTSFLTTPPELCRYGRNATRLTYPEECYLRNNL